MESEKSLESDGKEFEQNLESDGKESEKNLESDGNQAADKDCNGDKENIHAAARPGVSGAVDSGNLLYTRYGIHRALADTVADSCEEATSAYTVESEKILETDGKESEKILEIGGNQAADNDRSESENILETDGKESENILETDGKESEKILETDGNQAADKDRNGDKATSAYTVAEKYVEARNMLSNGFGFTPNTIKFRIPHNHEDVSRSVEHANDRSYKNVPEDSLRQIPVKLHLTVDCNLLSEKRNVNSRHEATQSLNDNGSGIDTFDNKSHASFDEQFEIDVIYTKQLREEVLKEPPKVPVGYVEISPSHLPTDPKRTLFCMIPIGQKKPEKKTNVFIPHDNADSPYGDEFGAVLSTYKERRKDGTVYYRHFLVDVDPTGPAGQMKISDNDEIVLLDEVFAPELTHQELLDKFRALKVDGQTRFTLVIRRVESKKKWKWIETSAILSADKVVENRPHVESLIYKPLDNEEIEVPKSKHLYKVPGTQKYLDICDGKVTIGTFKGDSSDMTKIICKRAKYWEDDDITGQIDFAAALCDLSERWYIGINKKKEIVVEDKPIWFKMIKIGSKIRFQLKEVYLGYDKKSDTVKAEVSQCVFEELPAPVDGITNLNEMVGEPKQETKYEFGATFDSASEISSELSSIGDHTIRRNTASSKSRTSFETSDTDFDRRSFASSISSTCSDKGSVKSSVSDTDTRKRSIASSQTSVDSDRGSILSPQVSVDEFGDIDNKTSDLSLSQSSGTSGYRSENSTEDVDFGPLKDTIVNVFKSKCGDEQSAAIQEELKSNNFKL